MPMEYVCAWTGQWWPSHEKRITIRCPTGGLWDTNHWRLGYVAI